MAEAFAHLRGVVRHTPLLPAEELVAGELALHVKAESLQRTGSFKLRGAYNRLRRLTPGERTRGVVTASAGNHAQGLALAARLLGVRATVVMPEHASLAKLAATRAHGAEVLLAGAGFDDAQRRARDLALERGLLFVPAFDDPLVVAGQGTVGTEIVADLPEVRLVVVPVGGGGLAAGVACAVKAQIPSARVVGVQAAGCPGVVRALAAGRPVRVRGVRTIADGIAVERTSPGVLALLRRWLDDLIVVSEEEIARAMLALLERSHLLAEGAGAVAVAALLAGKVRPAGGPCVAVVSGGNVDPPLLAEVVARGLVGEGRHVRLGIRLPDRPGALERVLTVVARSGANLLSVSHDRLGPGVALGEAAVELFVETHDRQHAEQLVARLRQAGYAVDAAAPSGPAAGSGGP